MTKKALEFTCFPPAIRPLLFRVLSSEIGMRLYKGVFWSMAGAFISRGLMFCATVIVARILGKVGYGELGMIQSTVGMFGVFAGFGLGLTATKHVAELREKDPDRVGRIIGLSGLFAIMTHCIMALGLFFSASWLTDHTINAPHLTNVLRIGAPILLINAINGAQTGALAGFEAFRMIAHVNLLVGIVSFPILICGAYFGGLEGAVWALVLSFGINTLCNHVALRKEAHIFNIRINFRYCLSEFPLLWQFSIPAMLSGTIMGVSNWACRALLTNRSNGYEEIGILSAALVIQSTLLSISSMLGAPLLSMISNAGHEASEKLGVVNILLIWMLSLMVATPLLCFPEIVLQAYGREFDVPNFHITLSLVIFASLVMIYKEGLSRVLIANSMMWWGFLSNTIWGVSLIFTTFATVHMGAVGVAISLAIAYLFSTSIFIPFYYSRKIAPKEILFSTRCNIIWLIILGLTVLSLHRAPLYFRSAAFIFSNVAVVYLFKSILKKTK